MEISFIGGYSGCKKIKQVAAVIKSSKYYSPGSTAGIEALSGGDLGEFLDDGYFGFCVKQMQSASKNKYHIQRLGVLGDLYQKAIQLKHSPNEQAAKAIAAELRAAGTIDQFDAYMADDCMHLPAHLYDRAEDVLWVAGWTVLILLVIFTLVMMWYMACDICREAPQAATFATADYTFPALENAALDPAAMEG